MTIYSAPVPGLTLVDHWIDAPLDHRNPDGRTIRVYAREVRASEQSSPDDLPWLLFLQGGPGGASPRPLTRSGWIGEAVKTYRVLLLDQRGTGLSSPVTTDTPARFATQPGGEIDDEALAEYLAHLRADAIVADAELFRQQVAGGARFTTLGQSYGGWCTFTYLSHAPHGLEKCLITGGVPGVTVSADDVYRRTWPRVLAKNAEHHRRWPDDQAVLNRVRDLIVARADDNPILLPGGDAFTVHRLQALGGMFGMSYGFADIHYLLEQAFVGDDLSPTFLAEVEQRTSHRTQPLYAILQEVLYAGPDRPTRWAAQRIRAEFPPAAPDADDLILVGEMKEPPIFTDEAALRPFAGAMEILNARTDWPDLFNLDQLARNEVPVAAAVYFDDLYVDAELSLATVAHTPHVRAWVTNEFEHDGLRSDERVFTHLHDLATGRA